MNTEIRTGASKIKYKKKAYYTPKIPYKKFCDNEINFTKTEIFFYFFEQPVGID